jgi:hypothetical protein
MPIQRLLEHTVFGPFDIEAMSRAYDAALTALGLVDRSDPVTEIVAKKIIAIAQTGERDPVRLSKLAIEQLGIPVVISPPHYGM